MFFVCRRGKRRSVGYRVQHSLPSEDLCLHDVRGVFGEVLHVAEPPLSTPVGLFYEFSPSTTRVWGDPGDCDHNCLKGRGASLYAGRHHYSGWFRALSAAQEFEALLLFCAIGGSGPYWAHRAHFAGSHYTSGAVYRLAGLAGITKRGRLPCEDWLG